MHMYSHDETRPSDLVQDDLPDVTTPSARPSEEDILEAMRDVVDPELNSACCTASRSTTRAM